MLWNIIKIILALLLVGFVVYRTNIEQVRSMLAGISVPWFIGYGLLFLSLTLLKSVQYYYLNGKGVSFLGVLNVVVMQNVITNYFASTAGIASYLAVFKAEHGVKVSRAAIIFLLTKVGDLVVVWIAFCISSFVVWKTIEPFHGLVLLLAFGIFGVLMVFTFTVFFRQKFVSLIRRFADALRLTQISLLQKIIDSLEALSDTDLGKVAHTLGVAFLLSTIYFIFTVAWIYASFMTFNFQMDLWAVVFVSVMLQLISYVPIQIFGGLGITETSVMYFWRPFGILESQLASVMLGIRVLFYLINLVPLLYLPIYTVLQGRGSEQKI